MKLPWGRVAAGRDASSSRTDATSAPIVHARGRFGDRVTGSSRRWDPRPPRGRARDTRIPRRAPRGPRLGLRTSHGSTSLTCATLPRGRVTVSPSRALCDDQTRPCDLARPQGPPRSHAPSIPLPPAILLAGCAAPSAEVGSETPAAPHNALPVPDRPLRGRRLRSMRLEDLDLRSSRACDHLAELDAIASSTEPPPSNTIVAMERAEAPSIASPTTDLRQPSSPEFRGPGARRPDALRA